MGWKPEDIETVRQLAAKGFTASQIASHFYRVSRNSIIGLCHRQKIKLLTAHYGGKSIANARIAERRKQKEKKKLEALFPPKRKIQDLPKELPLPHKPGKKTILKLGYKDCRAIIGDVDGVDTLYCGDVTVDGKAWCETHMRIYTIPLKETNNKGSGNANSR